MVTIRPSVRLSSDPDEANTRKPNDSTAVVVQSARPTLRKVARTASGDAVHVLVQTLHDVRKRLDVGDFGLPSVPFGEGIDRAQIMGVGDTAFAPRAQRVFQGFHAGQVVDDEIRIAPKLVTLKGGEPEYGGAARHDEGAESVQEDRFSFAGGTCPQWQDRKQCG